MITDGRNNFTCEDTRLMKDIQKWRNLHLIIILFEINQTDRKGELDPAVKSLDTCEWFIIYFPSGS